MVKNYANTIRIDTAFFFENGGKNLRFQKYPDSCRQGLSDTQKKIPKHKLTEERFAWFPKTSGFIKMLAFYRTVNTILQQLYFQKIECR